MVKLSVLLLEGGKIINGVDDYPLDGYNLLLKGCTIEKLLKSSESVPADVEKIDVSGMIVMPGLIDAHLHLAFSASISPELNPIRRAINRFTALHSSYALGAYVNGMKCIESGFTTVRDCGSPGDSVIALRDAINSGWLNGPRILVGGTITSTMGHFDENWPVTLPRPHAKYVADGVDQIRKAVRERAREQVDFVKTSTSDSWSTTRSRSWWRCYTIEELKALTDEAHAFDLPISSHAYDAVPSVKNAVLAGVDNIDHGIYLNEEVVELMSERGTTLVPTLSVIKIIYLQGEKARDTNPYRIPDIVCKAKKTWESHQKSVKMALKASVKVGSGTDATGNYGLHGNYAYELELLSDLGMKPMDVLKTATKVNSEILGLEDKIGTIEPGKAADLIIIDGDPTQDVRILQEKSKIKLVMIGGKIVVNKIG